MYILLTLTRYISLTHLRIADAKSGVVSLIIFVNSSIRLFKMLSLRLSKSLRIS